MGRISPVVTFIRILSVPILIIILAIAFFFTYNTYLIDHSLETLKFSLNKVSSAQTVEEAQHLNILLGEVLIKEVSAEKLDTANVANLEFSQNIISEAKINDQLKDLRLILSNVVKAKEAKRSTILLRLDALNKKMKDALAMAYISIYGKAKRGTAEVSDLSLLNQARIFESSWQMDKAVTSYQAFIERYPDYKDAGWVKLRLGYAYLKTGDLKDAEKIFSSVAKEYIGDEEAQVAEKFLAKTKEIKRSSRERQVLLDKVKAAKTDDEKQKIYYRLGVIDTYNLNLSSAREFFKKAIELDPKSLLAQKAEFNVGWSLKFQNDLEKSALVFEDVINIYAKGDIVLNAKYQLADTYHKSGRYEEAIAVYKKIAQDYKDKPIAPLAQFQAGYSYLYNLSDPVKASEAFKTLNAEFSSSALANYATVDIVPTLETRFRDFAFKLLTDGRYEEAKGVFIKATEVNKNDAWAFAGLGNTRAILKESSLGLLDTERSIAILPDEYTHSALAFNLEMEGRIKEAIEEYKKALAKNKDYLVAHYNLGRLYELEAKYDDAIKEYKEAIRIEPNFPAAHGNLGHTYWIKRENALSVEEYKKALDLNPNYIEAHYNLGLIYKTLGRYEEAKKEFEETLRIMPNFKEAKENLEMLQEEGRKGGRR